MTFEDLGTDTGFDEEQAPVPEESSNRMFLIAAGVLGGIAILALICIAVYALVLLPRTRQAQQAQKATSDAQSTEVARIVDQTSTAEAQAAIIAAYTATPTATLPATPTSVPSPTLVVAVSTVTTTPITLASPTLPPDMATMEVLRITLTANAILYAGTATAKALATQGMPTSGFADEVGLPTLLGLAAILIVVFFLARRLRTA